VLGIKYRPDRLDVLGLILVGLSLLLSIVVLAVC
jgi:hypothetical protein